MIDIAMKLSGAMLALIVACVVAVVVLIRSKGSKHPSAAKAGPVGAGLVLAIGLCIALVIVLKRADENAGDRISAFVSSDLPRHINEKMADATSGILKEFQAHITAIGGMEKRITKLEESDIIQNNRLNASDQADKGYATRMSKLEAIIARNNAVLGSNPPTGDYSLTAGASTSNYVPKGKRPEKVWRAQGATKYTKDGAMVSGDVTSGREITPARTVAFASIQTNVVIKHGIWPFTHKETFLPVLAYTNWFTIKGNISDREFWNLGNASLAEFHQDHLKNHVEKIAMSRDPLKTQELLDKIMDGIVARLLKRQEFASLKGNLEFEKFEVASPGQLRQGEAEGNEGMPIAQAR